MAVLEISNPAYYTGLSSDTKPTGVPPGTVFFEYNTGLVYITYDTGANWTLYEPNKDYAHVSKTITFTGASGLGATGNPAITWFTTTGLVLIDYIIAHVTVAMVSTDNTGTITLGYVGSTAGICAATGVDGTKFNTVPCFWGLGTTPTTSGAGPLTTALRLVTLANIVSAIATNPITAGVMTMIAKWRPLSAGASLVAA